MTAITPLHRTPAWKKLEGRRPSAANPGVDLRAEFGQRPSRSADFTVRTSHVFFDYSRQLVNMDTIAYLVNLAESVGLRAKIQSMMNGEKVNVTESRAALHTALRAPRGSHVAVDGKNVVPDVHAVLEKVERFSKAVHDGTWTGATGKSIRNIVAIGIGGSYLGPEYLAEACRAYAKPGMNLVFVANVDAHDFVQKTAGLDAEETLFVVVSKTFTTAETMKNAESARRWVQDKLGSDPSVVRKHFVAVSTARDKVEAFGIDPENMFIFWEWVGGRYSATSAVGAVPLSLFLGYDKFTEILKGAHWMDEHFRSAPLTQNIPVMAALLDIWNINFLGYRIRALLPYSQALGRLPAHTQQVEMESNGKRVDIYGRPVEHETGEVVFGEPGTNGQHSFYQLIHQGTQVIPADFIGFLRPQPGQDLGTASDTTVTHHEELMTNLFAQADALAFGDPEAAKPEKLFPGNRPSSIFLLDQLTPFTAGLLLAFTEHRTVAKGFIRGINPFDQFGVELGKALGVQVRAEMLHHHQDPSYRVDSLGYPASHIGLNALLSGELPQ